VEIQFQPADKEAELLFDSPKPAVTFLPDWYRDMPLRMNGEKVTALAPDTTQATNLTLKGCSPFLDALSGGYMFVLPFDIEFRKKADGLLDIRWATGVNYIDTHGPDQTPGLPAPVSGSGSVLKWHPRWRVITPRGYSALFTHPVNRHDLPFRTFSGVVDTDVYPLSVDFPFQIVADNFDDIFILEKGTPICQVVPFKREAWNSAVIPVDEEQTRKSRFDLKSKIVRSYKSNFWQKKSYL
jgi:hypothetical protein